MSLYKQVISHDANFSLRTFFFFLNALFLPTVYDSLCFNAFLNDVAMQDWICSCPSSAALFFTIILEKVTG